MKSFEAFHSLSDGIVIIDSQYQVLFWNQCMADWSGITQAEALGQNITILFPSLEERYYKVQVDQVLEQGLPARFATATHHHVFPFKHESMNAQRVTISSIEVQGNPGCALFSIHDISTQIQHMVGYEDLIEPYVSKLENSQVLVRRHEHLVAAVNEAAEAFIIMRSTGEIEYINKAFTDQTDWSWEEVKQRPSYWFYKVTEDGASEEDVKHVIQSGDTWQGRCQILRKDQSLFTASISIAPIASQMGEVTHAVVVQEDISAQLKFEDQYRKTQKQEALATLIGGIAHDFNNLLSGMLGHLYLANREVKDMPRTVERLKKVQAVSSEIATTVQQLMTFARKGEVDRRQFPLDSFVKEFTKLADHNVPENIAFSIDFERTDFPCQGDVESLQVSLLNIVQNAVDAAVEDRESEIKLFLKRFDAVAGHRWVERYPILQYGNYAEIKIWDNGKGIAKEHLERIFDPFFTTKHLGSGLGLAVVIGNIKKNRGMIDVESSSEGTSVHVWLPLLMDEEDVAPSLSMSQPTLNKMILLVDDETLVRDTCAEILEFLGYRVSTAQDGQAAVEHMERFGHDVDLILMDMVMPRMSGSVAAGNIRKKYPHVPIVFATAYDQALSIKATREFEKSVLISKPFHPEVLQETIEGLIVSSID